MAKYYENSTVFNYNFEQVMQGFWKRYPNPYSSHVLSEDTIERNIRSDGQLYSKRVLTKTNRVPEWGKRFFKANFVCIIEESLVDPNAKTLTTFTRNIGFNKIMVSLFTAHRALPLICRSSPSQSVTEKVVYKAETQGKTVAYRSAWIDSQVFGFATAIRAFGCDRFKKNCNKTVSSSDTLTHQSFH